MKIVAISDTHGYKVAVPPGDVFVHAGDLTGMGTFNEVAQSLSWIAELPHKHKIIVAGNHDWLFEKFPQKARCLIDTYEDRGVVYLEDSSITIEGIKFYGSPWQPEFCGWAFNVRRDSPRMRKIWSDIDDDVNILITHGPPNDILDTVPRGETVGCEALARRIEELNKLALHIFGHIHLEWHEKKKKKINGVQYINASICNNAYEPVNSPIVIEI